MRPNPSNLLKTIVACGLIMSTCVFGHAQNIRYGLEFHTSSDSAAYYQIMDQISQQRWNEEAYDSLRTLANSLIKARTRIYRSSREYTTYEEFLASETPQDITTLTLDGAYKLDKKIQTLQNLERLEIVNGQLKKLPRWLVNNSKLNQIDLYNNRPKRRMRLAKNKNIKKLTLSDGGKLPRHYSKFPNLVRIDVSHNKLQSLPKHLHKLDSLEELNFSYNLLDLGTVSLKPHTRLKRLLLNKNELPHFPDFVFQLPNLEVLQLADNQIDQVPVDIDRLQALHSLMLYKNKLKEIPGTVFNLENLVMLDLYYNDIERIPEGIGNLRQLQFLYLSFNRLFDLPKDIGYLSALRELYLHHNRLSYLPDEIGSLERLRVLHAYDNSFQQFPQQVYELSNLRDIDFSQNQLTEVPYKLADLPHLRKLFLYENEFSMGSLRSQQYSDMIGALERKQVNYQF